MKTDICICTRNRPNDLRKCVESALQSEVAVNSIIVSDDSTDDATRRLIETEFPKVRWLSGPRRGLGANRNNAISAVEGDFVVFLDDDAMLDKKFLSKALAFSQSHGINLKTAILTGFEINNGAAVRSNDQNFLGYQRRTYETDDALNTIVINSSLIPAEVAKRIRFDELLVYGFDEVDFAMRARVADVQIVFCPELRNLHFPSTINRDFYKPFTDASRVYVTFKRYYLLEKNRPKANLFLVAASMHLLAANLKRHGLKGVSGTWMSLRKAYDFKSQFLAQQSHARLRPRS